MSLALAGAASDNPLVSSEDGPVGMDIDQTPGDGLRVMAGADVFCSGGAYLHLEQDWRRGLGWWLVRGNDRHRVTVRDAIGAAPPALGHEVLLEAQRLGPTLELDRRLMESSGPEVRRAVDDLTRDVALAREAYGNDPRVVGIHLADRLRP